MRNVLQQHGTFLKSLEDHESQADDSRFRDLCSRHIPHMRVHQRMLEEYQSQLGDGQSIGGRIVGSAIPVGEGPIGITTGSGSVWVANHDSNTVTRIQP